MSPRTNLDAVRPFLEGPTRAVLATAGAHGLPPLVVVDYLVLADGLMLNGRNGRRWVADLRRRPRAAALVHDPAAVEHWVRIAGPVELVREADDASVEDAKVMARRYGDDPSQFDGQHRVTWRLVADQVVERVP